jgi:DNA repair exonuclease SbcCD nuclease subunit
MNGPPEDDMALKILHTADWHLGQRFPAFHESDEKNLTRARLDVIDRILGEAENFAVDAVLCAGDLFDNPDPEPQWWRAVAEKLQRRNWTNRPVFLLPGNHDPLHNRSSVYHPEHAFRRELPAWVHVVENENSVYELSPEAVLYASPCRSQAGERDLASLLPRREPGDARIRLGMVHGQTFDIPGCQTSFPISQSAVTDGGFDYLAIGDTHSFRDVTPDTAPTVYPGAPEPTRFNDQDAGYVAIVFFPRARRRPLVNQRRVGRWTWKSQDCRSVAQLRQVADMADLENTVMRLALHMTVSVSEMDDPGSLYYSVSCAP